MAKKVVLAGACRTAIGKMGGGLSTTPAPVLGSIVIKEALKRANVPADQVDHVYMGCVIPFSETRKRASSSPSRTCCATRQMTFSGKWRNRGWNLRQCMNHSA